MVSSRSYLTSLGASSPSLGTALASAVLLLNLGATMVNAKSEEVELGEPPGCLLDCYYAKMWENSDGEGVPEAQCVKDVLGSEWRSITENGLEELPEDTLERFQSCALHRQQYCYASMTIPSMVSVGYLLEMDARERSSANARPITVLKGFTSGIKPVITCLTLLCFPPPTDVVKILGISVPSGVVVPTTVSGVPLATSWPGETTSSTIPSASGSPNGTTSGSGSPGGGAPSTGSKNAPSSLLTILCTLFAVGFVSVGARADHNNDGDFDSCIPSCASRCLDRLIKGSNTCTSTAPAKETSSTSGSQEPAPPSLLLPLLPPSLAPSIPLVSRLPMHPSETRPGRVVRLLEYLPQVCLLLLQFCRRDKL
ncbi:hypothetical protein C7212DRAFT_363032 [Tuber magnatum]|uniref:Uncharacterized protein n=1 Tax=Tuber magnatum TaxID=42249 RepID=A0A317SY22_9PEZI|nr:hypothetical protein C7212DRAFT_363032 [Tuber magnatum]